MKERPILFKAPMVCAILDDQKTHTRRLEGLDAINREPDEWEFHRVQDGYLDERPRFVFYPKGDGEPIGLVCPKGEPGDRLWVKETFCWKIGEDAHDEDGNEQFWYAADNPDVRKVDGDGFAVFRKDGTEASPWISSLFMPRKASRITLEITGVRVERLQEISEEDAKAEGAECPGCASLEHAPCSYREGYRLLWESINGKGSWEANPYAWVIEFKKVEQ